MIARQAAVSALGPNLAGRRTKATFAISANTSSGSPLKNSVLLRVSEIHSVAVSYQLSARKNAESSVF